MGQSSLADCCSCSGATSGQSTSCAGWCRHSPSSSWSSIPSCEGCTGEQACQCSNWCENTPTANSNAPSSGHGQDVSTHGDSSSQSQQYAQNGQLSSAKHSMTGVTRLVVLGVAATLGLSR